MEKLKMGRRKSELFFRFWILLLSVILVCSVLLALIFYKKNSDQIQMLQKSHGQILVDRASEIEEYMLNIAELGELLKEDETIRAVEEEKDAVPDAVLIEEALSSAMRIYNWNAQCPYKMTMFVYFPQNGIVLDIPAGLRYQDYSVLASKIDMTQVTLDRLFNAGDTDMVDIIWDKEMDFARLMIVERVTQNLVLIAGIADSELAAVLQTSTLPEGSSIQLFTMSGKPISWQKDQEGFPAIPYSWEELSGQPDISVVQLEDSTYYQYYSSLADGKLAQLAFVPVSYYRQQHDWESWIFPVVLLLAVLCSWLLARIAYRPLYEMRMRLPRIDSYRNENNDIAVIEETIGYLERYAQDCKTQLDSHRETEQKNLFYRTLCCLDQPNGIFQGICEENGIRENHPGQKLFLIAARPEDFEGQANAPEALRQYMKMDRITKTLETAFSETPHILALNNCLLLGLLAAECSSEESIRNQIREQQNSEEEAPVYSIVLSRPFSSFASLKDAYSEVLEVLQSLDWTGEKGEIILCGEYMTQNRIDSSEHSDDSVPVLLSRAEEFLETQQYSRALGEIAVLCDKIAVSPQHFYGEMSVEANFAAISLCPKLSRLSAPGREGVNAVPPSQIHSAAELRKYADTVLSPLKDMQDRNPVLSAAAYIREHFDNPNLSAGEISSQYGMLPAAFSKLFRKEMGVPYLEYLHRLRIDKAKELLTTTDKSLGEISELVGYTNTVTMNRAFKRYADTTPGRYRGDT